MLLRVRMQYVLTVLTCVPMYVFVCTGKGKSIQVTRTDLQELIMAAMGIIHH